MAGVALEHVEKVYPNGTRAIADCTLSIEDGELMVLVGPSGCGKSTLLRMIAGLEEITSGELRIGDAVVNDASPQERNIAMVFQDYALYPHMTVRGNLEFPLKMRRLARAEIDRQVQWAAQLLDIGGVLERLPKQLSGGQRQRVAMGRALVRNPAVFLLDEPLSNLDAKLRVQVRADIAELQQRTKTTMVYVTHDQTEAMTLGHRVAVLNDGRLQQVAPPREIYARPANTFVAGFIGNPAMNLLPLALLPAHAVPSVSGSAVSAGVRPEAWRLVGDGDAALGAAVEHVEWLGHETLAYARAGRGRDSIRLVIRLNGMHPLEIGTELRLAVEPADVHLFDAAGNRVALD